MFVGSTSLTRCWPLFICSFPFPSVFHIDIWSHFIEAIAIELKSWIRPMQSWSKSSLASLWNLVHHVLQLNTGSTKCENRILFHNAEKFCTMAKRTQTSLFQSSEPFDATMIRFLLSQQIWVLTCKRCLVITSLSWYLRSVRGLPSYFILSTGRHVDYWFPFPWVL